MEPQATALLLIVVGALLALSALSTKLSGRFGVPSLLFFLGLGVLARLQPWTKVSLPSFDTDFKVGAMALALILFDGGLNTSLKAARSVLAPSILLATVGVAVTGAFVAGAARLGGLGWTTAILFGAAVSSTDAAAVFTVLKASHTKLRERVGLTLELESGLNDPMAALLTFTLADAFAGGKLTALSMLLNFVRQLGIGAAVGVGAGWLASRGLRRVRLPASGLYPVLTVALAFGTFGLATIVGGSGFLATYVTAMGLAAGRLPFRASLLRVLDALAWVAQIELFLFLGLTIRPEALPRALVLGGLLAVALALVARPLSVYLCLWPFRYRPKERLFVAAIGLRGAVPIVLAIYPRLAGVPGSTRLFDLVFALVLVSSFVPGALAGPLGKWLGLQQKSPPPPPAGLEMVSLHEYDGDFVSYYVGEASAVAHARLQDLPLSPGCVVTLVVRGGDIVPPHGDTELLPGDHVYVFTKRADKALLDLLFGLAEE